MERVHSFDRSYHHSRREYERRSEFSHDRKGYDRESRRDTKYERRDERGTISDLFRRNPDYQYRGFSRTQITESPDQLARIEKNFYKESEHVKRRSPEDVEAFRDSKMIMVKSPYAPNPITTFEESSFPSYIQDAIKAKGFNKPTPIQAQGWPIVLKGHDLIGIAQTGSGKTLAFLLPAIVHIRAQDPLKRGDGPIGLVLAPTRELAMQIHEEFKPFGAVSQLRATCIYGGAERYPQKKDLHRGCELVIATPGRLIDFLESNDTNLKRVSYLVIDEADRMLDMGFVPQIERIVEYIRKDRQTLMWSATWPQEVQRLAEDLCKEKPVHIVVGNDELTVNKAVTQLVKVVPSHEKYLKLLRLVKGIYDGSKILIFCQTKRTSDSLSRSLQNEGFRAISIHGDKSQKDRDNIMALFKDQRVPILVATNLAARGLDVKDIRFVINYDFPTQMEEYVHRVGRTGRAGATGTSFTFFTEEDSKFARDLIKMLAENNQKIPDELYDMIPGRRFYDKNYASSTRYSKGFGGYDRLRPTGRRYESNRSSNHMKDDSDHHRHKETRHSDFSSRDFKGSFEVPTTMSITSLNKFNATHEGQMPTNLQQYNLLAQMHMMQLMQKQFSLPAKLSQYSLSMALKNPSLQSTASKIDPTERDEAIFDDFKTAPMTREFYSPKSKYHDTSPYHDKRYSHGNSHHSHNEDTRGFRGLNSSSIKILKEEGRLFPEAKETSFSSPNRRTTERSPQLRPEEISSPSVDDDPEFDRKIEQGDPKDSLSFSSNDNYFGENF